MDVFEKVKKILCDQLDLEEEQVTEEAEVIEDLGADSLDIVDLVMTLEEEFDTEIPDEDIENLKIKVDAGVTHLISQLFYDNEDFYRFLDKARAAGITVPIEAGIMPVRGAKSVRRMAERNASRIPDRLNTLLNKWGDDIQSLRR